MFCLFVFVFAWPTWVYYYANKEYIYILYKLISSCKNNLHNKLLIAFPVKFIKK
jgi:hypothetical protein